MRQADEKQAEAVDYSKAPDRHKTGDYERRTSGQVVRREGGECLFRAIERPNALTPAPRSANCFVYQGEDGQRRRSGV